MATQVGEAVIKLTFDGKDVKASLNKVESQVEKTGSSTGGKWGSAWAVAAGNLIAKGVSKVASMVTSTMSSAISRLDTLNNFPKVMTALGYSAEEADSSVKLISDSLDGLPTSLDAAVGDIQKLAATMGNLNKGAINATTVGLGLNNMFLAGGKGTEYASRAMEQYNQMLAAGKVDMQSWRTMLDTAPGQLDQLAKTLVGAEANSMDLYNALQKGTVSFDEMNTAIVKLNEEGGSNFASFEEQARSATGGIATQLENIGNTMNKIVAAALEGNLDDISKYTAQLAQRVGAVAPTLIRGFVGAFNTLMKALPDIVLQLLPSLLKGAGDLLMGLWEFLNIQLPQFIADALPIVTQALIDFLQHLVEVLPSFIEQMTQAIISLINGIVALFQNQQFLSLLLQAAITLFMQLVKALPQILTALVSALPSIIENIVAFLTDPNNLAMIIDGAVQLFMGIVMAIPQILGALLEAFGTLVGNLWDWITQRFGQFATDLGNFIGGIFKNAINGVLTFIENFINAPIDLLNGFIGIINDAFGWIGVNIEPIGRINLPRLAQGGIVDSATTAIIGEDGQEAVIPLEHNTGNWAGLLAETLAIEMQEQDYEGKEINVYMTNQISNKLDANEIGRIMIQSIRRAA